MTETIETAPAGERDVSSSIGVTQVMYALHALAPFTMWTLAVVAMIIGLVKRDEVRGNWLDSHYAWMSRTFWWGLLLAIGAWTVFWVLGFLTLGIGMAVLWVLPVAVVIWYLYRVIKGWLALNDRKPIA
ncbi:MAG TPA: hypothetical protein VF928_05425 [Usitatibacteraceae bacterium]